MESVIVFVEYPSWEWHYDLALDSLMLTTRATMRVYIFFLHLFSIMMMSRHLNPQDWFDDITINDAHPGFATYEPLSSESDPSMAMIWSIEMDPSEVAPPDIICLNFKASSTWGSRVEGHGCGG